MLLVSIASIFIGLMIMLIPFLLLLFLVRRISRKEEEKKNLELRVEILEEEIKQMKRHIEYVDDL